ncbi:hypothetical protein I8752_29045 [Nostocaceae cyanobacterium CENA369]|uniref:Uncharacterized protein n=1 Tax=Dendronalium phyllosphericum CENA369 TaxID=1725256 RepID=A0A8J7LIE4_9NOST|nr:hypothetical protein [Dendronalium phyllosphericum]MBH8576958.1 hypothetical protein [Dendronalium phyllosphericum CENA369]
MSTIKELKQQATALGLTNDDVKTFGKLSAKATWQAAIDNHLATNEPVETITLLPSPWDNAEEYPTAEQPASHANACCCGYRCPRVVILSGHLTR